MYVVVKNGFRKTELLKGYYTSQGGICNHETKAVLLNKDTVINKTVILVINNGILIINNGILVINNGILVINNGYLVNK